MELFLQIDNYILNSVYSLKNPFLDTVIPLITKLGNGGTLWILISLICLCFKKTRKCGVALIIGLILSLLVCNGLIKNLAARTRPFEANGIVDLIVKKPTDFSFPSGHSSSSFVSATVIFFYFRKYGIFALVLASIIAFSRLYLYVHYPSDVFVGMILGISLAFLSRYITDKIFNKKI